MRHYELMVILSPVLSAQEAGEAWTRIKDFIAGHQGELTHDQRLGTRRLAYPIRKAAHNFLEGNYHLCRFSTETAFTKELEVHLRLDERIIRYLTVATAPPKATPEPPPALVGAAQAAEPVSAPEDAPAREPVAAMAEAAPAQPAAEGAAPA